MSGKSGGAAWKVIPKSCYANNSVPLASYECWVKQIKCISVQHLYHILLPPPLPPQQKENLPYGATTISLIKKKKDIALR